MTNAKLIETGKATAGQLRRYADLVSRRKDKPDCVHGHLGCALVAGGPCLDETLGEAEKQETKRSRAPQKETKLEELLRAFRKQARWIEEHGETLAGYVARYGSKHDAQHYGDGGEAIYEADEAELARLDALLSDNTFSERHPQEGK